MEIINPCYATFTNFETLETLKEIKESSTRPGMMNLATITYETILYLEDTHCKNQSGERILDFVRNVKKFNLTKSEILLMVNDPPIVPIHIQILVEDSEERLTEEQVKEVLELAKEYLT